MRETMVSTENSPATRASPDAAEWPALLADAAFYGPIGQAVRVIEPHCVGDPATLLINALAACGSMVPICLSVAQESLDHAKREVILERMGLTPEAIVADTIAYASKSALHSGFA